MLTLNPKDIPISALQGYLLNSIAPRPVAFVSTMDKKGNVNLSPFSFFNAFSTNPPVVVFLRPEADERIQPSTLTIM